MLQFCSVAVSYTHLDVYKRQMWFDDTILDDFLKDWAAVQKKLYAGEITQAEYFEWKIMWPKI